MKSKVETLLSLQKQIDAIRDEIDDRVHEVARRYINAQHETNNGTVYGYPQNSASFEWHCDADGTIEVEWSDNWAYGGHDEGSFCFPANYLYDEEALVEFEKRRASEKEAKTTSKKLKQ